MDEQFIKDRRLSWDILTTKKDGWIKSDEDKALAMHFLETYEEPTDLFPRFRIYGNANAVEKAVKALRRQGENIIIVKTEMTYMIDIHSDKVGFYMYDADNCLCCDDEEYDEYEDRTITWVYDGNSDTGLYQSLCGGYYGFGSHFFTEIRFERNTECYKFESELKVIGDLLIMYDYNTKEEYAIEL